MTSSRNRPSDLSDLKFNANSTRPYAHIYVKLASGRCYYISACLIDIVCGAICGCGTIPTDLRANHLATMAHNIMSFTCSKDRYITSNSLLSIPLQHMAKKSTLIQSSFKGAQKVGKSHTVKEMFC